MPAALNNGLTRAFDRSGWKVQLNEPVHGMYATVPQHSEAINQVSWNIFHDYPAVTIVMKKGDERRRSAPRHQRAGARLY
jgi:hypothetical protein